MMRATHVALVIAILASGVLACNAIVGVQDVRLRKADAGSTEDPPDNDVTDPPPDDDGGDSDIPSTDKTIELALGKDHTCARKPDGTVKCWGSGVSGKNGSPTGDDIIAPQDMGITDATKIAAGDNHTCVIRKSKTVSCWGDNSSGQLGNGVSSGATNKPVDVTGISDATAIAAGGAFTCAIRGSGTVSCWGAGTAGQIGDGSSSNKANATAVDGVSDAVAIAAGTSHACVATQGGLVQCWGSGASGQLGTGSTSAPVPESVALPNKAVGVAAGNKMSCAVLEGGVVMCWGANELGQLGTGNSTVAPSNGPTTSEMVDAVKIFAGANHVCALRRTGSTVSCWGQGYYGQLGDGRTRDNEQIPQASPVDVSGLDKVVSIGAGGNHSCAANDIGAVFCWGDNTRGELGDGSKTREFSPVTATGYP